MKPLPRLQNEFPEFYNLKKEDDMLKKEFLEKMKNDKELQELRKKVFAITGNRKDITYFYGRITLEEWKEQLRQIVKEHEATSQE